MRAYLLNLLIAFDQLVNAAIFFGQPDETISSAVWRMERHGHFWGFMRPVIDLLFSPIEKNHCQKSHISEVERRHLSGEFK